MPLHKIEKQRLLVGRVVVKSPGLDTDLGRDLAHGNGRVAVARE